MRRQSAIDVSPPIGTASDGWQQPGGYEGVSRWALNNRAALEAYAQGIEQNGTQLQRFLSTRLHRKPVQRFDIYRNPEQHFGRPSARMADNLFR